MSFFHPGDSKEETIKGLAALIGLALIAFVLWEGFEAIVFPRHVTRKFRLTRLFYHSTWNLWSRIVYMFSSRKRIETYLSFYGPLSLIFLLIIWAGVLVFGFGLVQWRSVQC